MNIFGKLTSDLYTGYREQIIILILQTYNCRISEILGATWNNFYAGKFLILKGKKHSNDICIRDRELLFLISQLPRLHHDLIFYPTKYYTIHRLCIRMLNSKAFKYSKGKNRKTTHFFRYENSAPLDNVNELKLILHHNSTRSAEYYNKKVKGTRNASRR